jgi:hypothetical protein
MTHFARLSLLASGLGLFIMAAVPSFATVIGAVGGGETVTVTPAGLSFTGNVSPSPTTVGAAPNVAYMTAPLAIGQPMNGNVGSEITPFTLVTGALLPFPSEPTFSLSLNSFASPERSAAPMVLSPIILTATSPEPSAPLGVTGTAAYGSVVGDVGGNFKPPVTGNTSEDVVLPTYTTPYSANFVAATVPEPRLISISLVVLAGLLMGLVVKRRKSLAENQE